MADITQEQMTRALAYLSELELPLKDLTLPKDPLVILRELRATFNVRLGDVVNLQRAKINELETKYSRLQFGEIAAYMSARFNSKVDRKFFESHLGEDWGSCLRRDSLDRLMVSFATTRSKVFYFGGRDSNIKCEGYNAIFPTLDVVGNPRDCLLHILQNYKET